jgi:phosphoglycerate dehydrogenase-like enzyme
LLGDSVAEAAFAVILSITKRLPYWHDSLVSGHWNRRILERTYELRDKTLGIIGLGKIGAEVARRGDAFKMRLVAYDPYVAEARASELNVSLMSLDDLLAESDVVTLHAVSTPETDGLINHENLANIRKGAYFVNFARGALVENLDILYDALVDGRLAGVGLDVFPEEPPTDLDHPLLSHPNFAGSPHVLASTADSEARCYRSMCKDVLAVLSGQRPEWCVNPEVFDSPNLRTQGRIGGN